MKFPDVEVGKRLFVGLGDPFALGIGTEEIRGSAYIEGPLIFGNPEEFPEVAATCMIGPCINTESADPVAVGQSICNVLQDELSLYCIGNTAVKGNLFISSDVLARGNITAQGEVKSQCGNHILSKKKNFDIPHPTKEGWRLTHSCVEGPEAAIYIRGRINKNTIDLPEYWVKLVDTQTITVSLTPIGSHQDVIVKRIDENKIYLQSKGGMPIDCFYHIFGERKDTEKLISEYKGSIEDYPGDNSQRSIAGYHYDSKRST
jgi:hypothetical protein